MLNYQRVHSTHNFVFMIWARSQEPYPQWYGAPLPQEPPRHWTAYVLPIAYLTRGLPLIVDTYRLYTQKKHILIPFDSYIVLNTTWPYAWMQYVPTYMHTYTHTHWLSSRNLGWGLNLVLPVSFPVQGFSSYPTAPTTDGAGDNVFRVFLYVACFFFYRSFHGSWWNDFAEHPSMDVNVLRKTSYHGWYPAMISEISYLESWNR